MKVVYVAGPFTGKTAWEIEKNVRAAEELGFRVAQCGASPIIPHANTRFFHGEQTGEFWYAATMALLERSDAVICVEGWPLSKGASAEVHRARELGKPVFQAPIELVHWLSGEAK